MYFLSNFHWFPKQVRIQFQNKYGLMFKEKILQRDGSEDTGNAAS